MKLFRLAVGLAFASAPAVADPYLARCQMGECAWYDQSERQVAGRGSAAVPGDLVSVTLRYAATASASHKPSADGWNEPSEVLFFCSTERPAYGSPGGEMTAWDIGQYAGATLMVTSMYLHACHPEAKIDGENPFVTAKALGYGATPNAVYPSFADMIRK